MTDKNGRKLLNKIILVFGFFSLIIIFLGEKSNKKRERLFPQMRTIAYFHSLLSFYYVFS